MTITHIVENTNKQFPRVKPVKEKMNIFIDGVPSGIANRNGAIYLICGPPGSGKSSFTLGLFRTTKLLRRKFSNIWLFTPMASFLSVRNHPFEKHDKILHELSGEAIRDITSQLEKMKEEADESNKKMKEEADESDESDEEMEHSCIILDDYASELKSKEIERALKNLLIRTRHLNCYVIITAQNYNMIPMSLRKMVTFASIFKPRTKAEWESISNELLKYEGEDSQKIFNYVFSEPYAHLDIDAFEDKFYKNSNLLSITDTNHI